jgi:hypothetical protein
MSDFSHTCPNPATCPWPACRKVVADLDTREAAKGPARIHRPQVAKRPWRLEPDAADWAAVAARKEARA